MTLHSKHPLRMQRKWETSHTSDEFAPFAYSLSNLRLVPEAAADTDLVRHPHELRGDGLNALRHRVDEALELESLAAEVNVDSC